MSRIKDLHLRLSSVRKDFLATDDEGKGGAEVDLYIDYSDCMTTATLSQYYNQTQPAIIACNPNYYSIKGNNISFETNDKMRVHQLLNSITNVDYSNIKEAVDSIVNKKHEAILITDGEYYLKNVGPNLNNPYLADEFKIWLNLGFDIYVYSEPYTSGSYTKNRYYMLFTDHRINNNIQEIFSRNAPQQEEVKMVHLYSGIPSVIIPNSGVELNEQLLCNEEPEINTALSYECHKLDAKWKDVKDYILGALDNDGNPLEGGDFFMKGISLNVTEEDAYKPDEIEVKCYEISELYEDTTSVEFSLPAPMKNMFVIDSKAWENGEIVVKLDPNFDGTSLTGVSGNLLRLDICVKKSKENFSSNENIGSKFKFDSPYGFNTSVYESLKQTLLDPTISPEESGNTIIYTVYLSTYTI